MLAVSPPRSTVSQNVILALLAFFAFACGGSGEGPNGGEPPEESRETKILEVTVGPELAECTGIALQTCMMVDNEYFYDKIEGFDYESGYRYKIRMERYDRWPNLEEPPQDASRYGYRLIEILEKVQEP